MLAPLAWSPSPAFAGAEAKASNFVSRRRRDEDERKGSGTPADALFNNLRTSGCGRATERSACADPSAVGRARLPAFHHGSCQGEYLIPKARPGPRFVGRQRPRGGLSRRRRHPHFQRCTPRAGHNAGRLMPEPPECAADEATPAGTALAPLRPASPGRRPLGRDLICQFVPETVTIVKRRHYIGDNGVFGSISIPAL